MMTFAAFRAIYKRGVIPRYLLCKMLCKNYDTCKHEHTDLCECIDFEERCSDETGSS